MHPTHLTPVAPTGPAVRTGPPTGTGPSAAGSGTAAVRTGPVPVPVPGAVRFRAACPDCRGRFELAAGALRLAIGATSRTTFYTFTCPECSASVRKPAGERIVELLTGGGVRTLRLHAAP
ncbi:hypothetical protein RM717_07600 [Streptomyces griseus]|uniref:Uncharacterized protein n=1 Tax=Streptomyces stephensoniae TaxID=3375367 RepID=A0ABU2VXP5_9ACTN|nr:hypothetical protein [Streptomyces griseus]MDT0490367.1 hypothetical protein [Streptomyces griseus]